MYRPLNAIKQNKSGLNFTSRAEDYIQVGQKRLLENQMMVL